MKELEISLKLRPIVYICRDLERAIGLPPTKGYFIITNWSPFAKQVAEKRKDILVIKEKTPLDTRELLRHPKVTIYLRSFSQPNIVVFKNTTEIEKICREAGWNLLNPPAALSSMVEEKISQLEWLGPLEKYLPPHSVVQCKNLQWNGAKFILQFNRAHTGSGTLLIELEKQAQELAAKFPNREARITQFVSGPSFTNNNIVWGGKILLGNINYQITGLTPFTTRPFATIGNDWALPHTLLNKKQFAAYYKMASDIGRRLAKSGWKGLFGIDVIMDEKTGKLYLIEVNARQPASTTFESQLQAKTKQKGVTTFEAHLAALLELNIKNYVLRTVTNGAQIVQKVTPEIKEYKSKIKKLKNCTVIPYSNTEAESDLLRIQINKGILDRHNYFNKLGTTIGSILNS